MEWESAIILAVLFFGVSALYSSVGHGGASGYLATMALIGVSPVVMKPTALILNILVAGIAAIRFLKMGFFSWRLFWPFAIASIPCAYIGGTINLPATAYKQILGLVLLFSAVRLILIAEKHHVPLSKPPAVWLAMLLGGALGLLAGLTGVGGGIFLSPLLLFARWAEIRQTSGIAALFILVNSLSGLAGYSSAGFAIPSYFPLWGTAVVAGGWIGSAMGSNRVEPVMLKKLLGVVLAIAGFKLLLT